MNYYLYISESKINMLYEQIEPDFQNDSTNKFGLDLSFFKIETSNNTKQISNTNKKMMMIIEHLKQNGKVGTLTEPKQYIEGIDEFRWGVYNNDATVWSNESLILLGSSNNIISSSNGSDKPSGYVKWSASPDQYKLLCDMSENIDINISEYNIDPKDIYSLIHMINTYGNYLRNLSVKVKYFARVLQSNDNYILASPICVYYD